MSTGVTTPYRPLAPPRSIQPICVAGPLHGFRRTLRLLAITGAVAGIVGAAALMALAPVPAAECAQYDSCTLAAVMAFGTP